MSETKTVVGKIGGVGEANSNGFANIKVETGNGDVWISSKVPGLIGLARDARGETRAIDYVERVGKTNPKTGQPYVNRYLEAVRLPAQDEVNGNGVTNLVNSETGGTPPAVGTFTAGFSPSTSSTGTQDDFRRSKEEMRWTEALSIAATMLAPHEAGVESLRGLALNVEALIRERV